MNCAVPKPPIVRLWMRIEPAGVKRFVNVHTRPPCDGIVTGTEIDVPARVAACAPHVWRTYVHVPAALSGSSSVTVYSPGGSDRVSAAGTAANGISGAVVVAVAVAVRVALLTSKRKL